MVALLKDNGDLRPVHAVLDTAAYEQLAKAIDMPAKAHEGLRALMKRASEQFIVVSK
ncbi:MAG: hypothetical protein ACOH2J_22055 [Allorhizobium sp.]